MWLVEILVVTTATQSVSIVLPVDVEHETDRGVEGEETQTEPRGEEETSEEDLEDYQTWCHHLET